MCFSVLPAGLQDGELASTIIEKVTDKELKKIIIIDRFYIALFSALEQTHCARM